MKTFTILTAMAAGSMLAGAFTASAQEVVAVEETVVTEQTIECKDHYTSSWRDNWYLQLGAGMQVPFVDKAPGHDHYGHHITAVYNLGFGHWFSPYLGFRFSGYYGKIHYDHAGLNTANYGNLNFDIQWDMLNSIGGVHPNRVFSIIPYFGVGGALTWDHKNKAHNRATDDPNGHNREWMLPVSTGIQLRLRLCKYVDFFADCRATWMADNFNTVVYGDPIEADVSVIGGLSFTFGGRKFQSYNPCEYVDYINTLNNRVNDLRGELAATAAALAAAEAQLPCPEVQETTIIESTPMLSCVRFKINSAVISNEEMVNVYNTAEWMKANPEQNVVVQGFADKDTGTAAYNMELSQRRCQSVVDALVNKYGIDPARLTMQANGSDVQPYDINNWNRIVIFTQP